MPAVTPDAPPAAIPRAAPLRGSDGASELLVTAKWAHTNHIFIFVFRVREANNPNLKCGNLNSEWNTLNASCKSATDLPLSPSRKDW
jgi:hypothetical protein